MNPALMTVLVIAVLALAIAGAVYAYRLEKKRREALVALADRLGLSFNPSYDSSHDEEYAHFEIFRRGHSRVAMNTLSGDVILAERRFVIKMGDFRYKITTSSGKSTTTHTYRFSYMILHLPWRVPDLLIRREGIFDKLAGAIGFDDIDFESAEFSKRFYVKSRDKRFAYDVIHPQMMEFLLAREMPAVDIERSRLCLSDGRTRWQPEQFERMIHWAGEFFTRWPEHVVRDLEGGPGV